MSKEKMTRRKFVAGATLAAASPMIVPRHVLGGVGFKAPSDTVNFALIGCGGQGKTDSGELVAGGQNLVALCDVDFGYVDREVANLTRPREGGGGGGNRGAQGGAQPTAEQQARMQQMAEERRAQAVKLQEAYKNAKRHSDFRKMLETQKDIDAIVVATPDHAHAVIGKTAMELGKHAYIEKPLTWSIAEARMLREMAAKNPKLATQMGNMGHSSEGAALVNEWVQAGVIGKVSEVCVWTNRPVNYWPQGVPRPVKQAAPAAGAQGAMGGFGNDWSARKVNRTLAGAMGEEGVPTGLDWDLFLGPAPEVPYHGIYHPFNWRGWTDWGTGAVGDMAAHLIDHPYWALGLTYPTSVEATFSPFGTDNKGQICSYPIASQIVYHFPARGAQPKVKLTWVDGGLMAPRPDALPDDVPLDPGGGVIFIGEKGILVHATYASNPKLYPQSLHEVANKVPKTFFRVEKSGEGQFAQAKHRMNWINAIKGKEKATCPFEYASRLTETMLLGVVAMKTGQGKRIYYDGNAGRITNIEAANQHLQREYRKGWTL